MALVHLMYASTLHAELLAPEALAAMMAKARKWNALSDISALLLVSGSHCFQVLEGDSDAVDTLFSKIALDSRHRDVSLMMRARIGRRNFAEWSLGEVRVGPAELAEVADLPTQLPTTSMNKEHARRLIAALLTHRHWYCSPPSQGS